MLLAAAPWFDQSALREAFTWGDWSSIWKGALKFISKQLRLRESRLVSTSGLETRNPGNSNYARLV